MTPERLKSFGYLVSTASVVLLALPAAKTAFDHPWLAASLIVGMAASIAGMALRWYSYRREKREQR